MGTGLRSVVACVVGGLVPVVGVCGMPGHDFDHGLDRGG